MRREGGITLVEILIAVAIASMVAGTAYVVLRAVVRGAEAVQAAARERATGRAILGRLGSEVAGAVALRAPARPGEGASVSLLALDADGLPSEISYAFEGETLVRWARPREAVGEAAGVVVPGVEGLALRFGRGGSWSDDWAETAPPEAVAVRLRVEGYEYVTVIPVGAGG